MKKTIFKNVTYVECTCCAGEGEVEGKTCPVCGGTGGVYRQTEGMVTIYKESEYKEVIKTELEELKKGEKAINSRLYGSISN